jgi:hypothetical protein
MVQAWSQYPIVFLQAYENWEVQELLPDSWHEQPHNSS